MATQGIVERHFLPRAGCSPPINGRWSVLNMWPMMGALILRHPNRTAAADLAPWLAFLLLTFVDAIELSKNADQLVIGQVLQRLSRHLPVGSVHCDPPLYMGQIFDKPRGRGIKLLKLLVSHRGFEPLLPP
jgi:hypothetical protein